MATTHGMRHTAEYNSWRAMLQRCYDTTHEAYASYGGRGIVVCDRWLESFENFIADMGRRPTRLHTVDRKDNDGNYEPGNCHWVTRTVQARNRRSSRHVTIGGERLTLAEWAERSGVCAETIAFRIKSGWPAERLLLPAIQGRNQYDN